MKPSIRQTACQAKGVGAYKFRNIDVDQKTKLIVS